MGVENNECVIATTWNKKAVTAIFKWIHTLETEWSELFVVVPSVVNGKQTIILAPDGSKKGWEIAEQGNALRNEFIKRLKEFDYDDGSNPFDYVVVGFGEYGQKVLRGNNVNCYNEKDYAV